ncbi:MAG: hypothetical protein ABIH59_00690 [archaeon]
MPKTQIKEKPKKPSQTEFEKKVIELGQNKVTSEKIGETLRKQNIHPIDYPKKISKILKENNLYVSPDLKNTEDKLSKIKKHLESNKQDKRAMREKDRVFAQTRKIKKYLKMPLK